MRRSAIRLALTVFLAGCGSGLPTAAPDRAEGSAAAPAVGPSDDRMEMEGVDLRLFDGEPTADTPRMPTFWVHTNVFSIDGEDIWSFEQARAVIYGRNQLEENILLEAGSGRFQEGKMAYLRGGVVARVGDMRLDLTDLEWLNDERLARTDQPVSIATSDSHLTASSLRMYPDQKQLVLTNVTGTVRFGRTEP